MFINILLRTVVAADKGENDDIFVSYELMDKNKGGAYDVSVLYITENDFVLCSGRF